MKTGTATTRRRLLAVLIALALPGAAVALLAEPSATGASDPCAASEVARTVGSVAKSMGDYLDSHPETNQVMTAVLQQQVGPGSVASLKAHFEANPKVASDLHALSQPLTDLSTRCLAADQRPAGDRFDAGGAGRPPVDAGPPPGPAQSSVRQRSPTGAVSRRLLVAGQGSALDLAVWFRPGRRRVCPAVG